MENLKTGEHARELVIEYLSAYIGERALAGSPQFDHDAQVWRVPILVRTPRGIFLVGEVVLDSTPTIVRAPTKQQVGKVLEAQLDQLPYIVFAAEGELEAKGFHPIKI